MYLELCTQEQINYSYAEFNTTAELVENNVEEITGWLRQQPHLPNITDKKWLTNFLLRCKNNVEKTKEKLEMYFVSKTLMPDLFQSYDPCAQEITDIMNIVAMCDYLLLSYDENDNVTFLPVPKLTPDGYKVMIFRFLQKSGNTSFSHKDLTAYVLITTQVLMKLDDSRGFIIVVDYENMSFRYFAPLLKFVKKAINLAMRLIPFRYPKIYVLHVMPVMQPLFHYSMKLMPKKIGDRIEIWRKPITELCTSIPKECLPLEYGGTEKSFLELRDDWRSFIKQQREWLIAESYLKADLSKKIETN